MPLGALGRLLGTLAEASKRHLGLKPMKGRFFAGFLKILEILGVHVDDVLTSKIVFFKVPRGYPR